MRETQKRTTAKKTTAKSKTYDGFSEEERDAMKEHAKDLKAAARGGNAEAEVLAKIAEMAEPDRVMAERIHAIVMASTPELTPRLWYGMPAYARDGKIVCFFQPATKFKSRYATLGFSDQAQLDDGALWPVAYALTELTTEDDARIGALVKQAVG
jgi:uncharacterized protein YdhG (YjbR/CyaY superfamily)